MENHISYSSKSKQYFNNLRPEMLAYAPKNPSAVLDVGCGIGSFAEHFKNQDPTTEVWGIEYVDSEAQAAKERLGTVFSGACENHIVNLPDNFFDIIYFNDVLEHLVDPYTVLEKIRLKLKEGGVVISSIPNVRYFKSFKKVLFQKDWKYASHGTMDRTHLRFFTKKSIDRMYREAGYKVITNEGINRTKSITPWLFNIPLLFTQMDVFYLQYATVARK